jgi:HK97 family phage portal protein
MLASAIRNAMGIRAARGPLDDFWYQRTPMPSLAGVTVDEATALSYSTFWACVRILSDTVGAMPWHVYQREGEGDDQRDEKAKGYQWYYPLHERPNVYQDAMTFKAMGVAHLILRGNFYCRVIPGAGEGEPPQLLPLNPDKMELYQDPVTSVISYQYKHRNGEVRVYQQEQMLHVKMLSLDGVKGLTPLEYAKQTLGLGIAEQRHASSIFGGGGFFKYFLKTTKRLGPEGRKNLRESWKDIHGDPGSFSPPILEDDLDIKTLGMTLEDSQLLESRKLSSYEICQFLGVPPHLVFLLDRATFSNIEHQSIEFSTIHLNPWLVRFEQAMAYHLDEGYFSEFARDSIIRGDIQSRYDAYSKALQGRPFMVPNDVRRLENLPPVDGWDEPIDPLNMAAPGQQGRQTAPAQQQPAAEPDEDEDAKAVDRLRPLVADAARHIVSREVVGLRGRANKAAENRGLYDAWAGEWFAKHVAFVGRELAPVFAAAGGGVPDGAATEYCELSRAELQAAGNVAQLLNEWETSKPDRLAAILEARLCTNES